MLKTSIKNLIPQDLRSRYSSKWQTISLPFRTVYGKLRRQFLRPAFPKLENGKMYLHLGCGSINHDQFINIDGLPAAHIHYIREIDNLSPFKDKTIDLIYASHCLEHFSHRKVSNVLSEWFRVLKDGGILRISVPDFDLLLKIYTENGNNMDTIIDVLMGQQDYKYNFHMTAFNKSILERLLTNVGFKETRIWQPNSCTLTTFNDFSSYEIVFDQKSYPISLNIEAIK